VWLLSLHTYLKNELTFETPSANRPITAEGKQISSRNATTLRSTPKKMIVAANAAKISTHYETICSNSRKACRPNTTPSSTTRDYGRATHHGHLH
jgi:hypothetical protein